MTFEEFKEQVEVFGKIDTAEKLAFYKRQYESHLLRSEDQKYFEPNKESSQDNSIGLYEQNLKQIFSLDDIKRNEFYFFVRPSFEPEYLLVITQQFEDYLLTCTRLVTNYWLVFYADSSVTTIDSLQHQFRLPKSIGDKLFHLLDKTIESARPPKNKVFVLDGVIYTLSKVSGDEIISVFKHSPDEESKSGKVISIMKELSSITETLDDTKLNDIETRIKKLND
jgi:hypothetical protein